MTKGRTDGRTDGNLCSYSQERLTSKLRSAVSYNRYLLIEFVAELL